MEVGEIWVGEGKRVWWTGDRLGEGLIGGWR